MALRAAFRNRSLGPRDLLGGRVGLVFRGFASSEEQDVLVIGGGPGGYVAAIKAAQLGLKTTCVEGRGSLGGTCLNVGCIPSKALLHTSHMYHEASHHFKTYGIDAQGLSLNLANMMKQKESAVTGLTKGIEGLFKKNKVTYAKGWGRLLGGGQVEVSKADGSKDVLRGKHIILATGSDVAAIPNVPIDEERIVSSTGALSLKEVPKRLIVIGAGVIGLEMGSVWSRLGSEVTVVEFMDAPASFADSEIARTFKRSLEKQGLKFMLKTAVKRAEQKGDTVALEVAPAQGGDAKTLEADVVLVSVGRKPYTEGLGLDKVGVKTDNKGRVLVDDHFKTNVDGIYAIGDVIPGPMLAHKAEEDGVACVELIAGKAGHVNYDTVPNIIYTDPELAYVGKTEEQVKAMGVDYKVGKFSFMANSRARAVDTTDGMVKMISDAKTDKLLGVHILGPNAGELIAECVLAMEYGGSAEDIARTCHGHPTLSEAVKEAALATYFKPIHM